MRYPVVLLDNDHTLLDSDASEHDAFERIMLLIGVDDPDTLKSAYLRINRAMWAAVERHEMTPEDVRLARFAEFVPEAGLDVDPEWLAYRFTDALGACGDLYPSARDVLEQLSSVATLALVTNGLSDVQRARIERLRLEPYFDAIVISGEVGVVKPGPEIFDLTFGALGDPPKETVLMVGDSLTSDIAGGAGYGIDTCWYNRNGAVAGEGSGVIHEITDLRQLPPLVRTGAVHPV
ncbi:noncanonical pyrimidine nucleotidase, YjjG family [bacterium]|nr:noncanonical pyrimidine nucleotidase, YjjG family [bacterium]